jgi:hypothetical protein
VSVSKRKKTRVVAMPRDRLIYEWWSSGLRASLMWRNKTNTPVERRSLNPAEEVEARQMHAAREEIFGELRS